MKHIYCKLFSHQLVVKDKVTGVVKEFECTNCHKEFTTSDKGKIIPLTHHRKEINKTLKRLYKKRQRFKEAYS